MNEVSIQQEANLNRLRWHCRRGIKEVEVLLIPFFEAKYCSLSKSDQRRFELLLEQHDVDLFEWFTHRSSPSDSDLQRIVAMVLPSSKGAMNVDA